MPPPPPADPSPETLTPLRPRSAHAVSGPSALAFVLTLNAGNALVGPTMSVKFGCDEPEGRSGEERFAGGSV